MVNSEVSEISYVIQAGVTTYPIGFEYHFNENNYPQLLVKIGESVAIINVDFQLSDNELEVILIPTEEEAKTQTSPSDTRWMDRIVGKELLITRDVPFTQTSDYTVGRISPEQIEYDFDRAVMRDQEILHQVSAFAVDVALAESLANAAVETANEAATAANQATATANTALDTANTAIVTSNDAKTTATQASKDAVDAMADAASAVNKADAADMTATTAMEIAAEAVTLAQSVYSKKEVDDKISVINADIDANADAIQKTRADFIEADSEIHTILNNHAGELTTLHNDVDEVGDQVSGIEEKIPGTASATNPLVTKQQLLDEEMDIREDLNSGLSDVQTQITAQAAAIASKQDKLTAGENITIIDNVISSTGGGDFLPLSGGTITGRLAIDVGESPSTVGDRKALGFTGTVDGIVKEHWFSYIPQYSRLDVQNLNISNTGNITPHGSGEKNIGSTTNKFNTVYTNQISSAVLEAIIIPALSGTMARIEDIQAIGGDGTAGQVLTKTVDGFEWKDASGGGDGDYLPITGGEMTGLLTLNGTTKTQFSFDQTPILRVKAETESGGDKLDRTIKITPSGSFFFDGLSFLGLGSLTPQSGNNNLGGSITGWGTVYAKRLNNGADLAIPTTGGTIARIEDIDTVVGDISTALTAILGE